ncbi:hypothetical protein V494_00889 [Pseudogymnoascus sp. VKM F-4513 (FW-928)]|nr:hypothetical protein V494_00889 [Pseudogymnoascus sp. VKM F-4513 (FW-928)]
MSIEGYTNFKWFLVTSPGEYVAHVQTNRPSKFNAYHEAMWLELKQIFDKLSTDSNVRAVIFSGAGEKAFTTGLDVQAASEGMLSGGGSEIDIARQSVKLRRHVEEFQDCITAIEKCEKPVIAAIHGYAFGLAIDLSCCADIRIASKDTKFSIKEVDIGLAADIGTNARLPKIVGSHSWVKEVALTARVFGAEEAQQVGFVSHVVENKAKAVEKAVALATLIASKSPIAVQGTKELLNHARENTTAATLRYTQVWNSAALHTDDVKSALLSGIQKTKPTFSKL